MGKFIKKIKNKLVDENKKELKKFMKANKKEVNKWFEKYTEFFNACGKQAKKGEVQMAFALAIMFGIIKSMEDMPKKHKLILIEKLKEEINKQ